MEGNVFALDIIRDFGLGITATKKKERIDPDAAASIKKLAAHYYKNGRAASMDEALEIASRLLR